MLSTLGPGGWATLRENPDRLHEVTREVESMGLKVIAQYALMGQWDFLNIIEAPDEATMAKAAVMLAAAAPCAPPPPRRSPSPTSSKRSRPPPRAYCLLSRYAVH